MTDGISLIRRRAASSSTDQKLLKPTTSVALPKKSNSESTILTTKEAKNEDEPFIIVSQDEFSEHASSVTHAKFSSEGDLIASCDMDNIVRYASKLYTFKRKRRGVIHVYYLIVYGVIKANHLIR